MARMAVGCSAIPVAIGKNGATVRKQEGDGKTPFGTFPVLWAYFRPDNLRRPPTQIPLRALNPRMGWCDDSNNPAYNRPVTLPFHGRHEKLVRDDQQYDIVAVLGYNFPVTWKARGSAIFFHIWRSPGSGTEGCIAISPDNMRKILLRIDRNTRLIVQR